MLAYRHRNAGAVIHTHSQHAVMATLLWPGEVFRCTHLEMIKGIYDDDMKRYLRYDEQLVVPIIENTPFERVRLKAMQRSTSLFLYGVHYSYKKSSALKFSIRKVIDDGLFDNTVEQLKYRLN